MVRSGIHLAESEAEKRAVYRFRYDVPFLAELPPEPMAVGERGMVVPRLRGSEIFRELGRFSQEFVRENRIQLIFGACEPLCTTKKAQQEPILARPSPVR